MSAPSRTSAPIRTSAGAAVRAALARAVREVLPEVQVFDGPYLEGGAAAGVRPSVTIGEPQATDWSAVGVRGRELRTAATVRVADGQRGRLEAICGGVERAGEALAGDVPSENGGEWRIVGAVFLRTRSVADKGGEAVLVEHRVRVVEF